MAENLFEPIISTINSITNCVQTHISQLISPFQSSSNNDSRPKFTFELPTSHRSKSVSTPTDSDQFMKGKNVIPLTKEELGRGTWALLHTIAAQYPDEPTRQQKRDVKELMAILSRLYPCKECADHFKEVLKANPVQAGSQSEFSLWLCHVHNVVNRSLGKLNFPCQRVSARWGKLDCKDRSCDLQATSKSK